VSGFTLQVMTVTEAVVAEIRRLRDEQGRSYRQIAAYLDRKQVKPPRAATWSAMTVRNIWERESK
jgi:hypothetical protein